MIVAYSNEHHERFGVEPICRILRAAGMQIAPSSYYAAKTRPPSMRVVADAALSEVIHKVDVDDFGVCGVRTMHAQLRRDVRPVARCTVERLMKTGGLRGISRAKGPRTTVPGTGPNSGLDLLDQQFVAASPRQLPICSRKREVPPSTSAPSPAGSTRCSCWTCFPSRRGLVAVASVRTDLALDALEMGLWDATRHGHDTDGLVHQSDEGFSMSRSAIPNVSPRPASSPRSDPPATPTTLSHPWCGVADREHDSSYDRRSSSRL